MKKLLSLIALAGVFAACQPEEITTTFEDINAVATIEASAFDVATGKIVTSAATFSFNGTSQNSSTYVITGNPTITKHVVNVTATWTNDNGETFTTDPPIPVSINDLLAGGTASYTVKVPVGAYQPGDDTKYTLSLDGEKYESDMKTYYLENVHYEMADVEGAVWYKNPTEFILTGKVSFEYKDGIKVLEKYDYTSDAYKSAVKGLRDALDQNVSFEDDEPTEQTVDIRVSAFAMYCVWQELGTVTYKYDVIATTAGKDEVAGAIYLQVNEYSAAQYKEKACEGHESHYVHGHGHDGHGAYNNAGGGIVYGD